MTQLLLVLLLFVPFSSANLLSYIDENGTKHIVDSEAEIPEQYRKTMKVTSLHGTQSAASSTATSTATDGSPAAPGGHTTSSYPSRSKKSAPPANPSTPQGASSGSSL